MINLMYLVLLCLLAMNVSKEILNSFLIINQGLNRTTENFDKQLDVAYQNLANAFRDDSLKVGPYFRKAEIIRTEAAEIVDQIEFIKARLKEKADGLEAGAGDTMKLEDIQNLDNQDIGAELMIGQDQVNPCTDNPTCALLLKERLEAFNASIAETFPDNEALVRELQIPLEAQKQHDLVEEWEVANFYHLPLAATITNLTRFQAAVRNSEAVIVKRLSRDIFIGDDSFDTLAVKVIPHYGTYINQGDSFKADIIVAAFRKTKPPLVELRGNSGPVSYENGVATFGVKTNAVGPQKWGGTVKLQNMAGDWSSYDFEHEYLVSRPNLVVSPRAMNVLYKGLENPIDISMAGIPSEDLRVSVPGCKVVAKDRSRGMYDIIPNAGNTNNTVNISVSAEVNGQLETFTPIEYRLKTVPKPVPRFRGKTGYVKMSPAELRTGRGIAAKLDNFVFNLHYDVVSYKVMIRNGDRSITYNVTGGQFPQEVKRAIQTMRKGHVLSIYDVVAKMNKEGAKNRPLEGSIIVEVK
ncbi:hypothetical protein KFE98_10030 [bacterium SCSIO 12741]|nr:hypothetical protein KFE98_10030 [bacterium SCSIO 12741]